MDIQGLRELRSYGGCVIASSWTTGSGKHTNIKTIPPCCKRIERWERSKYPKRIQDVFEQNPQAKAVVAIVDMWRAKQFLKGDEKDEDEEYERGIERILESDRDVPGS